MTDPSPMLPALQRMNQEVELFTKLSEYQATICQQPPIRPTLPAVLGAAMPALEAGFAYSASHWNGELCVTLHYGAAELGSSAPATPSTYSDTCARLLAGLLGIPLLELDQSLEPEPSQPATAACGLRPDSRPQDPEPAAVDPVEPDEFDVPAMADVQRPLSEEEKAAAISMIKAMATEQRKAFTKVFRETFQVPPEAKQVVPFITELQHLRFIDRYTVEAAGGVAA